MVQVKIKNDDTAYVMFEVGYDASRYFGRKSLERKKLAYSVGNQRQRC